MDSSSLDSDFLALPEVQACGGVWQNAFHSYDVLGHTVAFVRKMKVLTDDPHLVAAGWLHDIGKPVVAQPKVNDGEILQRMPGQPYHTFPNHEAVGAEMVRAMQPNLFSHHHLDQARVADLVACHYLPMRGIKRMREQTTLEAYRRHSTEDIDEFDGLFIGVEDVLAAGHAAVDMVGRAGNKQTGISRHRMSPMRGQETQILPDQPHDAPMRYVAPIVTAPAVFSKGVTLPRLFDQWWCLTALRSSRSGGYAN